MVITKEEQLRELGFHKYPKSPFDDDGIICNYQKRFDDEIGKKYFIDCHIWDFSDYENVPDKEFEFETQLYQKGTHEAINMTFFTKDIDEITNFIDKLFDADMLENYEL